MTQTVRVRIAPSPTGSIHVGLARTALFNFLFARQQKGVFVLRIEDTDVVRSKPEYETQILEGFHWLGLTWDEGPDIGGPYGPYRQSERSERYREHLERLLNEKKIYPCYCTPQELEQERKQQQAAGQPPVYSGKCRFATEEQIATWKTQGKKSIYRFAVPSKEIVFQDLVRGEVRFHSSHIGDFSVAKSLDESLYNFAVVIDDAAMRITHVIRGEDHISNTPKQIMLFEALGYPAPIFAHLPLLLAQNRTKLSKRDAVTSLLEYRSQGFLPEALMNFLALLGWNPKTEQEVFSLDELLQTFRLEQVQKSGAIFDIQKLKHLNAHYIRKLTPNEVVERVGERLNDAARVLGERLSPALELVQDRLTTLNDLPGELSLFLSLPSYGADILVPKKGSLERTTQVLKGLREFFGDFFSDSEPVIHEKTLAWLQERGYSNAEALWPLRVALSGKERSPGVFPIAAILGQKEVLVRIDEAQKKLTELAKNSDSMVE